MVYIPKNVKYFKIVINTQEKKTRTNSIQIEKN